MMVIYLWKYILLQMKTRKNLQYRKLNHVLTNRLIKFFQEQAKNDPVKYHAFYEDYGMFFREGIVTSPEQETRENIAKLLRFESTKLKPGERTSLEDYCSRMKAGKRNIFYLSAPSREIAEGSPYLEAMNKKDAEVLFLYESYDELVLMNLRQFDKKTLKSIENELVDNKEDTDTVDEKDMKSLKQEEVETLLNWLKETLLNRITKRLLLHPCVITVQEMGSARHFLHTSLADKSQEERFRLLQPTLEKTQVKIWNHCCIHYPNWNDCLAGNAMKKEAHLDLQSILSALALSAQREVSLTMALRVKGACFNVNNHNVGLQDLLQADASEAATTNFRLYENAMVAAGLLDDPQSMVTRLNMLLEKALDKVE